MPHADADQGVFPARAREHGQGQGHGHGETLEMYSPRSQNRAKTGSFCPSANRSRSKLEKVLGRLDKTGEVYYEEFTISRLGSWRGQGIKTVAADGSDGRAEGRGRGPAARIPSLPVRVGQDRFRASRTCKCGGASWSSPPSLASRVGRAIASKHRLGGTAGAPPPI